MGIQNVVYVAGPYSNPEQEIIDENVATAKSAAEFIWDYGAVAICPHLNTLGFEHPKAMVAGTPEWAADFEKFLVGDLELISRCDAVLMVGEWHASKGACAEFAFARYLGIPVFFNIGALIIWLDS